MKRLRGIIIDIAKLEDWKLYENQYIKEAMKKKQRTKIKIKQRDHKKQLFLFLSGGRTIIIWGAI